MPHYRPSVHLRRQGKGYLSYGTPTPSPAAPSWTVQPSISGTTQVGQTLTGADGTIINGTVSGRQWKRDGSNISGATSTTYLLTETDLDAMIAYQVTAAGAGGSNSATSTAVGPVTAAVEAPVISYAAGTFSNDNSDAGQWYRDDVAISGQTGSSYTYNAATDEGHWIGQRVGGVLSNVIVIEAALPALTTINGDQPDGTKLSAYPGTPFTMLGGDATNQDLYTTQGNRLRAASPVASGSPLRMPTAVQLVGRDQHYRIFPVLGTYGKWTFAEKDASNYMILEGVDEGSGTFKVNKYIGGVYEDPAPSSRTFRVAGSLNTGSYIDIEVIGGRFRVGVNGTWYAGNGFGSSAIADDEAYLTLDPALEGAEYLGILSYAGGGSGWGDIAYRSLVRPINISAVEVISVSVAGVMVNRFQITGTASPGVLNDAVVFFSDADTGALVSDWTAVDGAPGAPGGDFTIISQDIPVDAYGTSLHVYLSDDTDRTKTNSQVVAQVPFAPSGFAKAMNNTSSGLQRNLFSRMEIRFPFNDSGYLNQPGEPTPDPLPGPEPRVEATEAGMGYDGVIWQYVPGFDPSFCWLAVGVEFIEQGIYEIYYPAAMTCTLTNHVGGTLTDATILTAFSGGYGKIEITADKPSLRFMFTGGTNGALNLNPTGYLESDTNRSRLYADSAIVPFATINAVGMRMLDTIGGNGDGVVRLTADQIWEGNRAGPMSPELIAAVANAAGLKEVWVPCSAQWLGTPFLTAWFTRLIAALNPAIRVRVEPPNETWNTFFSVVTRWALENGVNAGFWNTAGDATPITSLWAAAFVSFNPKTGVKTMLQTYSTGDKVLFNNLYGVGDCLLQAKKNIVTGTADYPTLSGSSVIEDDAWLPIAQNSDCIVAKQRYYAEWADVLWGIVDDVCVTAGYNPREKIIRQICWRQGPPPKDITDWNNLHERVDAYGFAPYHNHTLLLYDESPLTSGEKALLATDIPAFIDACYTHAEAGVEAKVAELAVYKTQIDAAWAEYGYAPNEKETVAYEFGGHVQAQRPDQWHANMAGAFAMFRRDTRYGSLLTQPYTQGWKDTFHSTPYYFNSVGELPDLYNGQYGYWPLMESNTDTMNVAYVGFSAVTDEV